MKSETVKYYVSMVLATVWAIAFVHALFPFDFS